MINSATFVLLGVIYVLVLIFLSRCTLSSQFSQFYL